MKRLILYSVVSLLVALASLANIVSLRLENLLRPVWTPTLNFAFGLAAALVIVLATLAVLSARIPRPVARRLAFIAALVLVVAAGFIPRVVDMREQMAAKATQQANDADLEMTFQSDLLDRTDDVEDRISAHNPYAPVDALALLEFASSADLSWQGLPDHTPEAFALIERAIDGKALDPNLLVPGPTPDVPPVTLTVAFYDKWIRPGSPTAIRKHDWDVLQILVAKGADLSSAAAAPVLADLAKTVVLGGGRFISLK